MEEAQQQLDTLAILRHVELIDPRILELAIERTKNDALLAIVNELSRVSEDGDVQSDDQ